MREVTVEGYFRKQVMENGGRAYKWVSPGEPGVMDRIAIFPHNRIFFVELKAPKGRLRTAQKIQRQRLIDFECNVYAMYSKTDVDIFIADLKRKGLI